MACRESVGAEMGDKTDLLCMRPLLLRADAGAVLARRVMAELLARENGDGPPGSAVRAA